MFQWNDPALTDHIDACVGCRACETACPSRVEYGALLELARANIEKSRHSKGRKLLLKSVTNPGRLKTQLALSKLLPGSRVPGFVSHMVTDEKPEANRPQVHKAGSWPPLDESVLPPVQGEVSWLIGCAMGVLFPRVHEATRRLLRRIGLTTKDVEGCCGALHAHNGFASEAASMAEGIIARSVGRSVITNSAGCGSYLKEHTGAHIEDISELLVRCGLIAQLARAKCSAKVTYHDACHLAHGQKLTKPPRELIRAIPGLSYVELQEADLCCGSGGIYNLTEPQLARQLLERKWSNVAATGADIVVTGNPGCHAWIEQKALEVKSPVQVMHTAEFLESALSGLL
jgi:glycolate oxidase iron-sulfur subunit